MKKIVLRWCSFAVWETVCPCKTCGLHFATAGVLKPTVLKLPKNVMKRFIFDEYIKRIKT